MEDPREALSFLEQRLPQMLADPRVYVLDYLKCAEADFRAFIAQPAVESRARELSKLCNAGVYFLTSGFYRKDGDKDEFVREAMPAAMREPEYRMMARWNQLIGERAAQLQQTEAMNNMASGDRANWCHVLRNGPLDCATAAGYALLDAAEQNRMYPSIRRSCLKTVALYGRAPVQRDKARALLALC